MFWQKLKDNWHPNECAEMKPNTSKMFYYKSKFEIAKFLQPKTICEIGVRAGYSAFSFLSAVPKAKYTGIEIDGNKHGGIKGFINHAEKILKHFDIEIIITDSQQLKKLPGQYDLIHIDGDHSYQGCKHDLELSLHAGKYILVDDYDLIPDVRGACEAFKILHPELKYRYISGRHGGNLLIKTFN